jgi:hypothetical protein
MGKISQLVFILVLSMVSLVGISFRSNHSAEAISPAVGSVRCSSVDGAIARSDEIIMATIAKSAQGYELYLREPTMQHRLILDADRVVLQASSSFDRDRSDSQDSEAKWTEWHLVAYDRTPIKLGLDGKFSINMMVSSRSSCIFEGKATIFE